MKINRLVQSAIVTLAVAVAPALANADSSQSSMQSQSQRGRSPVREGRSLFTGHNPRVASGSSASASSGARSSASVSASPSASSSASSGIRGYQDESASRGIKNGSQSVGQQGSVRDYSGMKAPVQNTSARVQHSRALESRAVGGGPVHHTQARAQVQQSGSQSSAVRQQQPSSGSSAGTMSGPQGQQGSSGR